MVLRKSIVLVLSGFFITLTSCLEVAKEIYNWTEINDIEAIEISERRCCIKVEKYIKFHDESVRYSPVGLIGLSEDMSVLKSMIVL